jgi:GTP-binding protein Era
MKQDMDEKKVAQFRSGYAAVVGRPNVGKSTFINAILGQKIAAVSSKPQTTRLKQLGILTGDDFQIIFIDTPGIHLARHALGSGMNAQAQEALMEADLILWLVDASAPPHEEDSLITQKLAALPTLPPVIQVLNKSDLTNIDTLIEHKTEYETLYPNVEQFAISAKEGTGVEVLKEIIRGRMPEGEALFPSDQVTDYYEREITADLIREAALEHLRDEVPHAIAVRVDDYQERGDIGARITATIFVEKDSQKGIVIGKGGEMLKAIGSSARLAIEAMSSRKVFLELRVKVNKNWRSNPDFLRQMGYEDLGDK